MAKQLIGIGSSANDGTGDNLRVGADKVNDNFNEIYTAIGNGSTLTSGTFITTTSTSVLTNKSIDLTDNTITGTLAELNTAVSDATLVDLDDDKKINIYSSAKTFGKFTPILIIISFIFMYLIYFFIEFILL